MRSSPYLLIIAFLLSFSVHLPAQEYSEVLGRPSSTSVTMSILFGQPTEVYWEYGLTSGSLSLTTPTGTSVADTALQFVFQGLTPDSRYFYRTYYRPAGISGTFLAGPERTFHTARAPGSTFSFAVEADPHLDTNSNTDAYSLTLQNVLSHSPDFLIDLGDIFMSEKLAVKSQANITARHLLYRPYFGAVCHSVPLYLVIGNHEGENGWLLDGTPGSLPVMTANTRKLFYPNPVPDPFYSGNTHSEPFVGLRENYYSWEWGNALFIVLDPYWYTTVKPGWGWTLGDDQYNWFRQVITTSQARFKFVFCHQLVGGNGNDGRGGVEFAGFYEHGGKNADSSWGFPANRPNWDKTIHELMVENHAAIFFHGHDHCYAKQERDGLIYQEVPQPSSKNITNITGTQYGYVEGILMPSRGFLLVTVTDSTAKVDYIRTYLTNEATAAHPNGEVAYSYTLSAAPTGQHEPQAPDVPFRLEQNMPNPFSGETTVRYQLFRAANVNMTLCDVSGRELASPVDRFQEPGNYSVSLSSPGSGMKSGVYIIRLTVGNYSKYRKMVCIN